MATTVYEPQASGDDGGWSVGDDTFANVALAGIQIGDDSDGGTDNNAYIRFPTVALVDTDTINNGTKLTVVAGATLSSAVTVRIQGVTGGSPAAPTNVTSAEGLPLTTAFVDWVLDAWTADAPVDSPELSSILQELATAGDAEDGVLLVLKADLAASVQRRSFASFDHASLDPPKLTIVTEDSGLTIEPGLLTNTQTFYAPTLTPGMVSRIPALLTNIQTFYSPTVGTQVVDNVALLVNTQAFFAPTVSPGVVSRTPGLLTNTQTFFAPEIIHTPQTIDDIALLVNTQTFYEPTVTPGAVSRTPDLLTNTQTFFAPDVIHTPQTISDIELLTNTQTFFAPTLAAGEAFITPGLLTNTQTFFGLTMTPGAVSRTPELLTNTQTFYGPNVIHGLPYQIHITGSIVTINITGANPTINITGAGSDINVTGSIP